MNREEATNTELAVQAIMRDPDKRRSLRLALADWHDQMHSGALATCEEGSCRILREQRLY